MPATTRADNTIPVPPVIYVIDFVASDYHAHDASQPLIYWDDAAVTRGDGVFESLLIRDGHVANQRRHFARFAGSADLMDLPAPDEKLWGQAMAGALEQWNQQCEQLGYTGDAKCTWTYSRGRASTGTPTAWLVIAPVDAAIVRARKHGVKVQLVARGWSLSPDSAFAGAKTINYAASMSALRAARATGFEDVIYWDSQSDRVVEGATATVLAITKDASGRRTMITPAGDDILPGTTIAALFEHAPAYGWQTATVPLSRNELLAAESVWLLSSVRTIVRVTNLAGTDMPEPDNAAEIIELATAALTA